ncbi:MAG: nuclear transport factor 2 family protein [Flavobacteriales bacterium]
MRYIMTALLVAALTIPTTLIAQTLPREVVQAQLDAYNAGDIDAFLAVFAEDAKLYRLGNDEPFAAGKVQLRTLYGKLFENSPDLHSEVTTRTVIGNRVIDYERITGRNGQAEPWFIVMIYEVEEGLIRRAWSLSE